MKRRIFLIISILVVIAGFVIWRTHTSFLFSERRNEVKVENSLSQEKINAEALTQTEKVAPEVVPPVQSEKRTPQSSLLSNVPFTTQAPFAEWNNPIFQNGCEEAAMVMAEYWLTGKELTKDNAKKEILAITKFEEKEIGQSIDTSPQDTNTIFQKFYNVTTSVVHTDITLIDIQEALARGELVIVPANGRALHNPNYTLPGPTTHMLVIIGYDSDKKEFITNDSGTRNGKGYRYDENVLFGAIRDYPTGDHLPIKGIHKDMMVVKK